MKAFRTPALLATCATLAITAPPAFAQDEAPQEMPVAEAEATPADEPVRDGATIYTPADFARFAPRNAADLVSQIPGFSFSDSDSGDRGLGQASANVLVNGERLASKSDSVFDQLRRIPVDKVVRIEIVDGATLDVPGLSGQVANIVTREGSDLSGQFNWRTQFRPNYAYPNWVGGEVSLNGSATDLQYTLSLSNPNGRGAAGGPTLVYDGQGNLIEETETILRIRNDNPKLAGTMKWDVTPSSVLNLNASYERNFFNLEDDEDQLRVGQDPAFRDYDGRSRGYEYELGADFEFPLGPGSLKLIGLRNFDSSNYRERSFTTVPAQDTAFGSRYSQEAERAETIARGEYKWKMWDGDWQVAGEAAFNSFDREAQLFLYDPAIEEFEEIDFPGGSGGVTEDRYEASVSHSRSLTPKLSMQLVLGGEFSRLSQTGPDGLTREFWRPKGQLSLAWKPQSDLDLSLRLSRRVGQLSFGDFLANVDLEDGNDRAGNNRIVPPQTWEARLEGKKALGPWGSTTLRLTYQDIDDKLELIPLEGGRENRGNLQTAATSWEIGTTTTINLDPVGINGAKLDVNAGIFESSLVDPLTGEDRAFAWNRDRYANVQFRHDIPGSDIAYELGFEYNRQLPYYRLTEIGRQYEGPIYTFIGVEHKDVYGLQVGASVFNLTDGRRVRTRTVYDGPRNTAPVLFREETDQLVGPIFSFNVKGSF